jgi:hypothetical protein
MAQADVLTLIDDLAGTRSDTLSLAEAATRLRYYTDVVYENGLRRERDCDASYVAVTRSDADYAFPSTAIRILAVLYDHRHLRPIMRRGLESYDPAHRAREGRPAAFTTQDEDQRTLRLIPVPDVDGLAVGALDPLVDPEFPGNNLTLVYTAAVTDVAPEDELWLALEVLAREFGHESDHYDPQFSKLARQLATMLRAMVGADAP